MTDDAGNRNNFIEAPSAEETKPVEPTQDTKNDGEPSNTNHVLQPQPVAARLEALREAEKVDRSATSTPEYARTAAEVAESAALVDPPTPLPETVDAAASASPQEAADTAAEVADTAQDLENDSVSILQPHRPLGSIPPASGSCILPSHQAEELTETVAPGQETIADIKEDLQKDTLDIAGVNTEHEPAPLFARML